MSLVGFKGQNHRQQVSKRGALDKVDDRKTPPELFEPLNQRFQFTLDAAASAANAQCERYYTLADDALKRPWFGRVWCNPPYSDLAAWVDKAWLEFWEKRAELVVMLLPANRTEQRWWQDGIELWRDRDHNGWRLRVEFLRGRQRFILPGCDGIEPNQRPPFGVCLAIWER